MKDFERIDQLEQRFNELIIGLSKLLQTQSNVNTKLLNLIEDMLKIKTQVWQDTLDAQVMKVQQMFMMARRYYSASITKGSITDLE